MDYAQWNIRCSCIKFHICLQCRLCILARKIQLLDRILATRWRNLTKKEIAQNILKWILRSNLFSQGRPKRTLSAFYTFFMWASLSNNVVASKGNGNQLNQQTLYVASHGWCSTVGATTFLIALFISIRLSTSFCWFKRRKGPPIWQHKFSIAYSKQNFPSNVWNKHNSSSNNEILIQHDQHTVSSANIAWMWFAS